MLGKFEDLVEKASEMGLKAYFMEQEIFRLKTGLL